MIEIKELVVRANVAETPAGASSESGDNCAQNNSREGANEDLIEACVRQVLAILKRQKER